MSNHPFCWCMGYVRIPCENWDAHRWNFKKVDWIRTAVLSQQWQQESMQFNAHMRSRLSGKHPPRYPKKNVENLKNKQLNANSSRARALGGPEVIPSIGVEHNGCYWGQSCQGQDFGSHQGQGLSYNGSRLSSWELLLQRKPWKSTPTEVSCSSSSTMHT